MFLYKQIFILCIRLRRKEDDTNMKYLKQFFVILFFSFIGEFLHAVLPLPVPASIYGLVLLFAALMSGIVRLEQVEDMGLFLIEVMPIMFVPAAVGLIESWESLRPILIPVFVIMIISTITVMVAAGRTTQWALRKKSDRKNAKEEE